MKYDPQGLRLSQLRLRSASRAGASVSARSAASRSRWALLTALSLVLIACTPSKPVVTVPPPPPPPASALKDQTVDLGYTTSVNVEQAFAGSWRIDGLPGWLTAVPSSGTGNLSTVLYAHRSAAVPTSASQAELTGAFQVSWTSSDSAQTGSVTLQVRAAMYKLTGQVQDNLSSLSAADLPLRAAGTVVRAAPVRERGVIVSYRSQTARVQAMHARSLASGERVESSSGEVLTLSTPDVPATLKRLRARSDVAFAVPDAVLSALDLDQPVRPVGPLPGTTSPLMAGQTASAQQALALPLSSTDDYAPLQWAYKLLGYPAVWRDMQQHPYMKPVTVAVLDTGVRYDHPDLKGQLYGPGDGALDLLGYSAATQGQAGYDNGDGDGPDTDPTDPATITYAAGDTAHANPIVRTDISHGTHVTGIISARWGSFTPPCAQCSGSGVIGASYTAPIKVLPIRVLDAPNGEGSESDIALGLRYAAGDPVTLSDGKTYTNVHPAQVINMSLGGPLTDPDQIKVLCDAVARATTLGSLVVTAGGNFGSTAPIYPAACPGAVSVASVSLSDTPVPSHVYYSDQYQQVALSAPGGLPGSYYNGALLNTQPMPDLILSTGWNYKDNLPGYYLEAGTSQAAPQVTALAALLLSKGVAATPGAALDRMLSTATDLGAAGRDPTYGVGLINPAAALGATAVSNALGLSVQNEQGRSFQPVLDSVGRFTAYLPDGALRVVAGRDSNGNGFAGETDEPRAEVGVTFGPSLSAFDVGTLTPR